MSKHSKKIIDAFKSGLINSYLADKLEKAIQDKDADTLVDMALATTRNQRTSSSM